MPLNTSKPYRALIKTPKSTAHILNSFFAKRTQVIGVVHLDHLTLLVSLYLFGRVAVTLTINVPYNVLMGIFHKQRPRESNLWPSKNLGCCLPSTFFLVNLPLNACFGRGCIKFTPAQRAAGILEGLSLYFPRVKG